MGLYYKSTRNSNLKVTASEAILKGLAPDGGLFCTIRTSETGCINVGSERKDISGDCISRNETVPDRFYGRRTEKLYR